MQYSQWGYMMPIRRLVVSSLVHDLMHLGEPLDEKLPKTPEDIKSR